MSTRSILPYLENKRSSSDCRVSYSKFPTKMGLDIVPSPTIVREPKVQYKYEDASTVTYMYTRTHKIKYYNVLLEIEGKKTNYLISFDSIRDKTLEKAREIRVRRNFFRAASLFFYIPKSRT